VGVAGLIQNPPASNVSNPVRSIWPAEDPPATGSVAPTADVQITDARGLTALQVPLVRGRAVLDSDTADAPRVAVVSRQLANQLWGARDPIGRIVAVEDGSRWQVMGVVEDIRLNWYDGGPRPTLYLPHAQTATRAMTLVLRSSAPPETLAGSLSAAVRALEPGPPPLRIYTLRDEVDDSLAPLLTLAWLLGALAIVALGLATGGIYGIARSTVAFRTRELGIRLALGARPRSLARLVFKGVAQPVGFGCVVGVAVAMGLTRWLAAHTFGLLALNPAVGSATGGLLVVVVALGAWSPSRRATRIDPILALRE
jgi:putative ABC transport system permease protein